MTPRRSPLPTAEPRPLADDESAAPAEAHGTGSASQTERALLELRELLVEGELQPGARISELWVVERLRVSRTPVRAALIRLQEEGLLEPIASGGFAVRSFTVAEIGDSIELRGTLEGLAARLAAERGVTSRQLYELSVCVDEIDAILSSTLTDESFSAYVDANRRFHQRLAGACNSQVIERQIARTITMPFASPSAFVMAQSIDATAREMLLVAQSQHRAVVDAIKRREGARAEALMREHARIAHRNLQAAMTNQTVMQRVPGSSLIRMPLER